MPINRSLIVARRNNIQKTKLAAFLTELDKAGCKLDSNQILPAAASVEYEYDATSTLKTRRIAGNLSGQRSDLNRSQIDSVLMECAIKFGDKDAVIVLDNYSDFIFRSNYTWFFEHALSLSDFDRDTILAVNPNMSVGFSLDVYTIGNNADRLYEIELWGIEDVLL